MNYAQDRSDRRIRYKDGKLGLWNDYRKALYGNHATTNDQSSTGNNETSSLGNNDIDTISPTIGYRTSSSKSLLIDHELLGRTLRDIGWNYHALYHYGIVWDNQPYCSTAVGDYSQMAELVGYPEIGIVALYTYYSNNNSNNNNDNNKNMSSINSSDDTTLPYQIRDDPQWILQQHPCRSDCGCGLESCQSHSNRPYISKNIRQQQHSSVSSYDSNNSCIVTATNNDVVETILQSLQDYCQGFLYIRKKQYYLKRERHRKNQQKQQEKHTSYDTNRVVSSNKPTINSKSSGTSSIKNTISPGIGKDDNDYDDVLELIDANELLRQLSLWKVLHQRQKYNNNNTNIPSKNHNTIHNKKLGNIDKRPFTFLNSVQFQHIPSNLQFWKKSNHSIYSKIADDDDGDDNNNKNDQNVTTPTTRSASTTTVPLEPLLQLLLLKLLYLVVPSLAIEAIVGITIESTMMDCTNDNTNNEAPYFDEVYFSEQYKSHWAYFVFLRALVLGERIKPHKYKLQPYHHIPLWDTIWSINNNNDDKLDNNAMILDECFSKANIDDAIDDDCIHINNFKGVEEFIKHLRSCLDMENEGWEHSRKVIKKSDDTSSSFNLRQQQVSTTAVPKRLHWFFPEVRSSFDAQTTSFATIKPLFVVGDSHVLSLAWQTISIPGKNHFSCTRKPETTAATSITTTTFIFNPNEFSSTSLNENITSYSTNNNQNHLRLLVPVVSTGLKAWHVQETTRFFTKSCLSNLLERIQKYYEHQQQQQQQQQQQMYQANCYPANNVSLSPVSSSRTIIVSAGEIDCREGMGGQLLAGYTSICAEHIQRTVRVYVEALYELIVGQQQQPQQQQQNTAPILTNNNGNNRSSICCTIQQILVLPVAPHGHQKQSGSRGIGRQSRRETMKIWNNELRQLLPYKDCIYYLDYSDELLLPNNNQSEETTPKTKVATPATASSSSTNPSNNYVLNPIFDADSTHMNNAFLHPNIFAKAIVTSGCNLDLL